ncbi:39S ribosomal protein L19, mitochondrial isoform X2 [Folsomia candida]|nr:39S ribosomal protein L19, mitochondrial isoform X2 [Folsomia candida]
MLAGYKTLVRLALNAYPSCLQAQVRCSSSSNKLFQVQPGSPSLSTSAKVSLEPSEEVTTSNSQLESSHNNSDVKESSNPRTRQTAQRELEDTFTPFRYVYPEFLPDPNLKFRNRIKEKLERLDMLHRRSQVDIPEFYVGSIMSVTVSDVNAPGKTTTFVGICMQREFTGLKSNFTLRNVVDGMGIEICYDLYNPTIQNITCLRLEKRLDDNLRYLRDAPLEYSTFPFDMTPEVKNPDAPVPINPLKIKLNPRPWTAKWHLWDLKGIEDVSHTLEDWQLRKLKTWKFLTGDEVKNVDLMKTYRSTIPVEEQVEIYSEFAPQLVSISQSMKKQKRKRTFSKPTKSA